MQNCTACQAERARTGDVTAFCLYHMQQANEFKQYTHVAAGGEPAFQLFQEFGDQRRRQLLNSALKKAWEHNVNA
jgi:hypothetical protein